MVEARRTRLIRARTLHGFRTAIAASAGASAIPAAVLVPTRSAADELGRTLECRGPSPMPELLTRDEWYARMHASLAEPPRLLAPLEREVLMAAAAREAVEAGVEPPFRLRAGLTSEMLAFYDELRRRDQTVARFEELLTERLAPAVDDRGAARMLQQTQFLASAFRAYERRVEGSAAADEHVLRQRLLIDAGDTPLMRLIVTVGDRGCDPPGLWIADFDLMARMPALAEIDVIATDAMLNAGWHERVHAALPGLDELDAAADRGDPQLVAPPRETERLHFLTRDREDELALIARRLKAERRAHPESFALDRHAIVFRRPLPYLYLARTVFASARIAYQAADAVPLAAEPYAAAIDLVIDAVNAGFTRASLVALLRSPTFAFGADVSLASIRALDWRLSEAGYLGGPDSVDALARVLADVADDSAAAPAARAAAHLVDRLAPFATLRPASVHLSQLRDWMLGSERPIDRDERALRARGAILDALADLASASLGVDDRPVTFGDVAARLHRWIEAQTFRPRTGTRGIHLVDADAAPYGDYDAVHVVGLIERDWPEASAGNIFYAPRLLAALGWPAEPDRMASARAAFRDLLRLPSRTIACSTITLEDEAIVDVSPFVDELTASALQVVHEAEDARRVFLHEALTAGTPVAGVLSGAAAGWLALRMARVPADDPRFRGHAHAHVPADHAVSAVERFLECPFKYFAVNVLGLEEDPEDEDVMSPRARGLFIHQVFQRFFDAWSDRGGAITADRLDEARELFAEIVEPLLDRLRPAEAALERTRLLGSPVATGLADAVFRMEAERPAPVLERMLEFAVRGEIEIEYDGARERVRLRGIADRIDLLGDHTLRVLDYKTGRAPQPRRALQLPIYSACAAKQLSARDGQAWPVSEAAYIAFGGPRTVVPMTARGSEDADVKLASAIVAMRKGEFLVQPLEPFRCAFCAYAGVCRKDYVGDE